PAPARARAPPDPRHHLGLFGALRPRVGREGRLALGTDGRIATDNGASGTVGVFHRAGSCRRRSTCRPADPAGPADTGRQGCGLRGLHRPTAGGTLWQRRGTLYEWAVRRRDAATGRSVAVDARRAVSAGE